MEMKAYQIPQVEAPPTPPRLKLHEKMRRVAGKRRISEKNNHKQPQKDTQKLQSASSKRSQNARQRKRSEPELEDDVFEVEAIIDAKPSNDGMVYKVRWKGYSEEHDTWELYEDVNADDLISQFNKQKKQKSTRAYKEASKIINKP